MWGSSPRRQPDSVGKSLLNFVSVRIRKYVLEAFRERLQCGTIKPNHRFSLVDKTLVFVVRDQSDLLNKVVPFFERYPIWSGKRNQFERFKLVLLMIQAGKHLTREGFVAIVEIASEMNTRAKRYSKESILSSLVENPQRLYAEP